MTMQPGLSNSEALEAINALRSNVVSTQSAGWSNLVYPLVAILDAAGMERADATKDQMAEHFATYGGAGGYPGHCLREPDLTARNLAANAERARAERFAKGMTV